VQRVVDKITFGSVDLPQILREYKEPIEQIELCGLCTDICVISNAMLIKASVPNAEIIVDASCTAGVTKESHQNALKAMTACHIKIVNND
jgi:nicotinamidase-related amidase